MSIEEPYFFFLPSLYTKGLLKDDRDDYSFVTYPRNVISESTRIIVKDFATRINQLDTSSKKRIKTISEYLAVALSLPTKDITLMYTAEMIYKNWLNNLTMFGSVELQNRFIRQIYKHLSLPFAFCQPNEREVTDGTFCSFLINIISDYKTSHIQYGKIFEKETWITLLNVAIGITDEIFAFDLEKKFSKSDCSKIRQKSSDLCFSIIQLSGLSDEDVWTNFKSYCLKWNRHIDFVRVWGHYLLSLFTDLNMIAYKRKKSILTGGIYSVDNPISGKMVNFLFFNILKFIDVKIILEDVLLMNRFAQIILELIIKSETIVSYLDSCFLLKRKYPSNAFLKLFGPLLTFLPSLDDRYDESISLIISSILIIISNFEIDYKSEDVKRLISYCAKNASSKHIRTIISFLKRGSFLFNHNNDILPYISQKSLSLIQQLYSNSSGMLIGESLAGYITSIYMSSSEVLRFNPSFNDSILNSFKLVWKNNNLNNNYQLLNFACSYDDFLPLAEKILEAINKINSTDLSNFDVSYISSSILLIGTYVRFASMKFSHSPNILNNAIKTLIQNQIISQLFTALMKFEYNSKIEEYANIVFSSQQMLINVIEYTPQIFDLAENRSIICKFISFIETLSPKTMHSGPLSKQFWNKIYTKNISPMNELISYQIATFFPSKDHFSRRLNSCFEVNENAIINKFNITNPLVNYFSIGQNVLVSFIESKKNENNNNKKESYAFIRGQYGKSVFQVRDSIRDEFVGERQPKLSDEIQYTQNSINSEKADDSIQNNDLFNLDMVPNLSLEDLQCIDDNIISDYKGQYEEKLDWNQYGFYEPFDQPGEQKVPLASQFVSSMNLMQNNNENEIHIYPNSTPDLQAAIKKLDEVDSLPLLPAVIHHILPCDIDNCKSGTLNSIDGNNDEILSVNIHPNFMNNRNLNNTNINDNFSSNTTSNDDNDYESCEIGNINVENELDFNSSNNDYEKFKEQIVFNPQKHPKRMTPALLRFLKEIGEPMKISEELHILPPLCSTVPVIPSFHSFIPIISPAMAIDEKDAQKIFNIGETSAMKIIFNETVFDIRPPICEKNVKQFVISISPSSLEINDDSSCLYNVTQLIVPNGICSPFTDKQSLTAKTIAFNIANIYEQTIKLNSLLLPTSAQKARKAMIQLTQNNNDDQSKFGTLSKQFSF